MGRVKLPGGATEGIEFNGTVFTEAKPLGLDEYGYFHFSVKEVVPNVVNYTFVVLVIRERTVNGLPKIDISYNRCGVQANDVVSASTEDRNRYGISVVIGNDSSMSEYGGIEFGSKQLGDMSFSDKSDPNQIRRIFIVTRK